MMLEVNMANHLHYWPTWNFLQ